MAGINEVLNFANLHAIILWHVDPLLGNDRKISKYTTAMAT
jgi:hypothetical protein